MLMRMLQKAVETNPAKVAIVQGDKRIRYDELVTMAAQCAAGLRRLGVRAGDCVAVALPNRPEFVASLFACARLRAVMLPLDPQLSREETLRFMADAQARVVIIDSPRAGLCAGANAVVVEPEALLLHPPDPAPEGQFAGPALYLYTSGSTDTCKRLCCNQENLVYEACNFVETVGLTAADSILCTIPLHHSYGFGNCLLDAVYTGSTLVLLEPDEAPFAARCRRVLELIRKEAIRFYPGVPYQFQILAALPDVARADLASLKLCVSSGDVLPRQTYERFLKRFGLPIRSLYGSTEAGSIAINMDPAGTMQFGSLGLPLKNVEIRIRDAASRDLPPDESGQIWVQSPVIPPGGYDNRPELTATVFRDGYYNTGDLGKRDTRGHLVMTGRKQTFVDVGGHKVDVGEVEEVLRSHPQVREAAALGIEVPDLGTLLKAVVVADAACREADILSYCRERLAPFKVPRLIEFRAALPRSALGKVLKSELADAQSFLAGVGPADFRHAWLAVAKEGRSRQIELLAARIQEQAALSLQCEPASIAGSTPFQNMGFDSLRAAELSLRLARLTGLPLSITLLWNYPSIDELAAALWVRMTEVPTCRPQPAMDPVGATQATTNLEELLDQVERLSDSEVDASFRAK
jgi:long-chain acyl-CoA synthetase